MMGRERHWKSGPFRLHKFGRFYTLGLGHLSILVTRASWDEFLKQFGLKESAGDP